MNADNQIILTSNSSESTSLINKNIRPKSEVGLLDSDRHYNYNIDGNEPLREGCFSVSIDDILFECFLRRSDEKRLYVILGGGRWRGGELAPVPSFSKWEYYKIVSGNLLCIEDPMYIEHPELVNGWFYGSKDVNYREITANLIVKLADRLGISMNDIVIYSSLANTSASIHIASYIKGSTLMAINPSIDLQDSKEYFGFKKTVGIDIREIDAFNRNNLYDIIINNKETTFILAFNVVSQQDYENQAMKLFYKMDCTPRYGLNRLKNNLFVWIYEAPAVKDNPHNSAESMVLFPMIDFVIRNISKMDYDDLCDYCDVVNWSWHDYYQQRKMMASLK